MTRCYNVDLTVDTDDLSKDQLKSELRHKLEKKVPEQKFDLVMLSRVEEVEE